MSKTPQEKTCSPLQALRRFCVDQCQYDLASGVKDCRGDEWVINPCPLFPLRFGRRKIGVSALKAIRQHCRICFQNDTRAIQECADTRCPLYPFRFGTNPNYSDACREQRRKRCLESFKG